MSNSFVIRNTDRGHDMITSDGTRRPILPVIPTASSRAHPASTSISIRAGRPGFGPIRVFGDEMFHGAGCGYNMHPHHNFVICAFVSRAN